jgi:hypothetical protein
MIDLFGCLGFSLSCSFHLTIVYVYTGSAPANSPSCAKHPYPLILSTSIHLLPYIREQIIASPESSCGFRCRIRLRGRVRVRRSGRRGAAPTAEIVVLRDLRRAPPRAFGRGM